MNGMSDESAAWVVPGFFRVGDGVYERGAPQDKNPILQRDFS